ncbi:hypothetical protein RugamoR57_28960 [Duganella caerulea]|uniref:hypothetical protein n=1 Tax=Duganella caerulea TaxID=2885762 RepID=UPI0030E92385
MVSAEGAKASVETFGEMLKLRLASPFILAYIFSWIGYNYQVIVILLSDDPFRMKLNYVNKFIEFHPYAPILWAVFAVPALSFLQLAHQIVKAAFFWLEREVLHWFDARKAMNRSEQVAEFSSRDMKIDALKGQIDELYSNATSQRVSNEGIVRSLHERIRMNMLHTLASDTGMTTQEVMNGFSGIPVDNTDALDQRYRIFRKSNYYSKLVDFFKFLENMPIENGNAIFDPESLAGAMQLVNADLGYFIDFLFSLRFVDSPFSSGKIYKVPVNSEEFHRARLVASRCSN